MKALVVAVDDRLSRHETDASDQSAKVDVPLSQTTSSGDRLQFTGAQLVLDTMHPIEGLLVASHRKPALVVGEARYALHDVQQRGRLTRYVLQVESDSLYDLPGATFVYDPERHLRQREAKRAERTLWIIHVALMPFLPLLGLLPSTLKAKLVHVGINPSVSTGASMALEWGLCWPAVGVFFVSILAEASLSVIAVCGSLPLLLLADLAYRYSGFQEDPPVQRGFMSVVRAAFVGIASLLRMN